MKYPVLLPVLSVVAAVSLLGAGCSSSPTDTNVPALQQQNTASDSSVASSDVANPASSTAPMQDQNSAVTSTDQSASSTSASTTTSSMTQEKLAFPGILPDSEVTNKVVHIKTAKGDIVFELLPKEGPKAASNFVYLAKKGFYDGLTFHRVESWVVQGGDPTGTGMGGPGYQFEDDAVHLPYVKGIVAMANAGPNTNGSQFFILTKDTPLDPAYSIFGRVISGQNIVDQMAVGDKMLKVTIEEKK